MRFTSITRWSRERGGGALRGWRGLLGLGCGLALVILLAGCVRQPGSGVELQFSLWGSLEQMRTEQAIVDAFEKENPGVKIHLMPYGSSRYSEKIQSMIMGEAAPDLMMVEMKQYDEWAARGVLQDVTEIVEKLSREDTLMPVPRLAFERDGRFFAMPTNVHGSIMFCNLDALKAAGIPFRPEGWTWEEILALSPKLARRRGDPQAPTEYALTRPAPEILFAAYGAKLFDDPKHPTRVTADSPEALAALNLFQRFEASGYTVPPDVVSDQGFFQVFRDGKVALFFSGRWFTPEFAGKTKFDWDVVPIPAGPAGHVTSHGGTAVAIWKGTRHPEEARKFLEFYGGRKGIAINIRGGRQAPVFEKLAYGADFLSLHPPASMARFCDTMKEGGSKIELYAPGFAAVQSIFSDNVANIVYRDVPVETALHAMQEDLERWLARQQQATRDLAATGGAK